MPPARTPDLWPAIETSARELWQLVEPPIEAEAARRGVPFELYYYSELGVEYLSSNEFRRRDPYSNPAGWLASFLRLSADGWVEPLNQHRYLVTEHGRQVVRTLTGFGDAYLGTRSTLPQADLSRVLALLRAVVTANQQAPEPPAKWATLRRFRATDSTTPLLGQIRDELMALYAYRDDAHLAAWSPLGVSGPAWNALATLEQGAESAAEIAERQAFRGYGAEAYEQFLGEVLFRGWCERTSSDRYRVTASGRATLAHVEALTDAYFYAPWACLDSSEAREVQDVLTRLVAALRAVSA
jgi:hypothetical protein